MKPFTWVLITSAVLHAALAAIPDRMGDLLLYRQWIRELAERGLVGSYWPPIETDPYAAPAIDYPPLLPYLMWLIGKGAVWLFPRLLESDWGLDYVLRLLISLANLATAGLIHVHLRPRAGAAKAALAAGLFALNPAVLFDSAYWGQADALCALFVVAALVSWRSGHTMLAAAAMTIACLTKPLAWPLAPLLILAAWRERGPGRALRAVLAGGFTAAVVLVPFLVEGRLGQFLRQLALQVDVMPYASVNAHNLWWIVTGGLPWTRADAAWLGPISHETAGLVLFAACYALAALWMLRARASPVPLEMACATVAFGLFVLATHMHENHLFLFLPLALLAEGDRWATRPLLFVAVTVAMTANMALHDPLLNHVFAPLARGPHVLLPQQADVDPALLASLRERNYGHVAEQIRGESSLVWAGLTLLNNQAIVLLFVAWMATRYGAPARRLGSAAAIAILVFLVASGLPFLARAASMPRV